MSALRDYPKIELHRHMEGAVRLQTLVDVAQEAGIDLKGASAQSIRSEAVIDRPMNDLHEVLTKFWFVQKFIATPQIVERIAMENVLDAFHDGIRILELRYSPGYMVAGHPKLNFVKIHEAIVKGIKKAKDQLENKIQVGLIAIISRDQPFAEAKSTAELVETYRSDFVGFDLAGPEVGYELKTFEPLFNQVRSLDLGITVHAGEAPRPEAPLIVKEAIDRLGATRIGHGVQIRHSKEVMNYVREKNVTLEFCPTSNLITRAVDSEQDHPLIAFLRSGLRVTLNSDDPHQFGIDLTHEYELAKKWGATEADFKLLNDHARSASFMKLTK
ncbi:MAG: adenosine deaminase [Oligoflexia bacterium]|nr:adenosine deaminase [Oligoflexia bacterium]